MMRIALALAIAAAVVGYNASAALAVTPGWECIPTAAGQAVVSGGTGAAPACGAGTTAVLAPTFISSGVGGKPTVQFSSLNVQIVSGSGATDGTVNGDGNLVVGYAENANSLAQTGSNNLIVGKNNGWTGFGAILGGLGNLVSGNYGVAFGQSNTASGDESVAAGGQFNTTKAALSFIGGGCDDIAGSGKPAKKRCAATGGSALLGGHSNQTTGAFATVSGGQFNLSSDLVGSITGGCENIVGPGTPLSGSCTGGAEAILGGFENTATGIESTVSGGEVNDASGGAGSVAGGQFNTASGGAGSVAGGNENTASGSFSSILGGFSNLATTFEATVSGGESNTSGATASSILGGDGNSASSNCQAIPAAPGTC